MNLADLLTDSAKGFGARPAVRLDDAELTYGQLEDLSARAAQLLHDHGVRDDDRVGVMLPNILDFPVVYEAILRLGAVVVPMNVLLKEREVAFYLGDSGARLLVAWHDVGEAAHAGAKQAGAEVIEVAPRRFLESLQGVERLPLVQPCETEETAVILYTSGTTGTPKGAELMHRNLRCNVDAVRELYDLDESWVTLGALPLFHSFGQTCSMNVTLSAGALLTLIPRFDPDRALDIIRRDRVTLFQGVPTMYTAMLHSETAQDPDAVADVSSSLRVCVSGGASLPVDVLRAFEDRFDCKILEGYGLSETSPVASSNRPDRERKAGSIGLPIEGVEMRVVDQQDEEVPVGDVGEIVIRGHNVMKGYWNRPDATQEVMRHGWFHSGDLARMDEEGYFFIVDRKKDMIIRGGYNVYPREVEEVLYEHPAVREAAVVGVPHPELGEEVAAAVSLIPGTDATPEELREFAKQRVAAYKYPRHVWIVDDLPKGPTGKVLKREVHVPAELGA